MARENPPVEVERFIPIRGTGVVAGHSPLPGRPHTSKQPSFEPRHDQPDYEIRYWTVRRPNTASGVARVVCFACGTTWNRLWKKHTDPKTEESWYCPELSGLGTTWSRNLGPGRRPCTCSYGLTRWKNHVHATDEQIAAALRLDLELAQQELIDFR